MAANTSKSVAMETCVTTGGAPLSAVCMCGVWEVGGGRSYIGDESVWRCVYVWCVCSVWEESVKLISCDWGSIYSKVMHEMWPLTAEVILTDRSI